MGGEFGDCPIWRHVEGVECWQHGTLLCGLLAAYGAGLVSCAMSAMLHRSETWCSGEDNSRLIATCTERCRVNCVWCETSSVEDHLTNRWENGTILVCVDIVVSSVKDRK